MNYSAGGGGVQNGGGGKLSLTPAKRGPHNFLVMLKWGTTSFEVVLPLVLEDTIAQGGVQMFPLFKRQSTTSSTLS